MATKKKAVKPAAKKPAPKKAVVKKPVKKVSPVKKQVKPAPKKAAKPLAKKPATKVSKIVSKAKPTPKKQVKPVTKPKVKIVVKAKAAAKKSILKPAKPTQKPALKTPVAVTKPVLNPMTKKPEEKPVKTAPKAPAKPAQKPMATNTKDIRVIPAKPVVIPKFNTKTSRKYQPDFTKSVLDQVKNDPGAPIVRYSDNDLKEFRDLINRKLDAAKKELNYLQGLITRKDEMGGDESDNRYMTMEDGSLSMEREQLSQMASRQITFIDHLEKAIMRIENKTYGICRITGKLIDKARLRAVPHATLSIEAKMGIVK